MARANRGGGRNVFRQTGPSGRPHNQRREGLLDLYLNHQADQLRMVQYGLDWFSRRSQGMVDGAESAWGAEAAGATNAINKATVSFAEGVVGLGRFVVDREYNTQARAGLVDFIRADKRALWDRWMDSPIEDKAQDALNAIWLGAPLAKGGSMARGALELSDVAGAGRRYGQGWDWGLPEARAPLALDDVPPSDRIDLVANSAANFESGAVRLVNPAELRWTQTTAGGNGRASIWRDRLDPSGTYNAYPLEPIDVVNTADGLATVDHTRAAIALEYGIPEIPVRVWQPNDLLPPSMTAGPRPRFGSSTTWGEAAAYRASRQLPPLPPTGTPTPPRLPPKR